ncbi:MAG: hypothetical protein H0U57_11055 [Tatlockia sp.]|nr:hypothetical protein [Tatlockia sp.]
MPLNFLNPFNRVNESLQQPASRLFRRTFFEKLADTFYVIAGKRGSGANFSEEPLEEKVIKELTKNFDMNNKFSKNDEIAIEEHLGLLDYATLGVAKFSNHLMSWIFVNFWYDNYFSKVLAIPVIIWFLIVNFLHYTAALLITVALMPFIYIVHKISEFLAGAELKSMAGQLRFSDTEDQAVTLGLEYPDFESDHAVNFQRIKYQTLESILNKNHITYSDIVLDLKKIKPVKVEEPSFFSGKPKYTEKYTAVLPVLVLSYEIFLNKKFREAQLEIDLNTLTFNDKKAIKALLALNAGGLFNNLEKLKTANLYSEEIAAIFADIEEPTESNSIPLQQSQQDNEWIENVNIESDSSSEEELGIGDTINYYLNQVEEGANSIKRAYRSTQLLYDQPHLLFFPTVLENQLGNSARENSDLENSISLNII